MQEYYMYTKRLGAASQRGFSIFLMLALLFLGQGLFAQEWDDDDDFPYIPWDGFAVSPYAAGDRNFAISMGLLFPTLFIGSEIQNNEHGIRLGGMGSLAFNYFLTPNIFVGGELAGTFLRTRGRNMLYIVPFGARIGYQFIFNRFEVPVSVLLGGAGQSYLGNGYFGPIVKPGASVFWRFNPDWSFGLNTKWWFVPQWPRNSLNVYGNFLEITLSARYHF